MFFCGCGCGSCCCALCAGCLDFDLDYALCLCLLVVMSYVLCVSVSVLVVELHLGIVTLRHPDRPAQSDFASGQQVGYSWSKSVDVTKIQWTPSNLGRFLCGDLVLRTFLA